MDQVHIRYAATALAVSTGRVQVHGAIKDNVHGVLACAPMSGSCWVDAGWVDWGSPDGPSPHGSGDSACGAVTVNPWIGTAETGAKPDLLRVDCGQSSDPFQPARESASQFDAAVSGLDQLCEADGFDDACEAALKRPGSGDCSLP